jgi:dolichol-phosphate mannosyltransferase
VLQELAPDGYEILFVNDGSGDDSLAVLRSLAEDDPRTLAVDLRRHFGKAAALAAGFDQASGEILVMLDADLQDRPEEIPRLIAALEQGADLVTGRKLRRQDPWIRRVSSRLFNRVLSWITGIQVRDANSGLKVLKRKVLSEVPLHGKLHRFLLLLVAARGFRVVEVPVEHEPRRHGRSRYGWSRYGEAAFDTLTVLLLTRFGKSPLHFFGVFGGLLASLGFAILFYLAVGWVFGRWIEGRPLLTFAALCVILGIQSLFFGLLAELIVITGKGRDRGYAVREVIGAPASPEARRREVP